MPNKLTDAEIKKALECCCRDDKNYCDLSSCNDCPLNSTSYCSNVLRKYTLDLINRLQAEIERLKAKVNHYNYCYENFVNNPISRIKSEARKEFAKELSQKSMRIEDICDSNDFGVSRDTIFKLLKEMESEENA